MDYKGIAINTVGQNESKTERYFIASFSVVFLFQLVNGFWLQSPSTPSKFIIVSDIFFMVIVPGFTYLTLSKYDNSLRNKIGLPKISSSEYIFFYTIVCLLVALLSVFLLPVISSKILSNIGWLTANDFSFNYASLLPSNSFLRHLAVLYLAVTAAVIEEVYYRGIIWYLFRKWFGKKLLGSVCFILVSALFFSLVHWEGGAVKILSTFIFGMLSAYLYLRIKNLLPLITAHFFVDFLFL